MPFDQNTIREATESLQKSAEKQKSLLVTVSGESGAQQVDIGGPIQSFYFDEASDFPPALTVERLHAIWDSLPKTMADAFKRQWEQDAKVLETRVERHADDPRGLALDRANRAQR